MSQKELLGLLASGVSPVPIEDLAKGTGASLNVTPQVERELRAAGATEDLLAVLRNLPSAR